MLSFINSLTKTPAPNLAVLLALPMGFEECSCVMPLKQKENTHPHNDLKTAMTRKVNHYFWRLVIYYLGIPCNLELITLLVLAHHRSREYHTLIPAWEYASKTCKALCHGSAGTGAEAATTEAAICFVLCVLFFPVEKTTRFFVCVRVRFGAKGGKWHIILLMANHTVEVGSLFPLFTTGFSTIQTVVGNGISSNHQQYELLDTVDAIIWSYLPPMQSWQLSRFRDRDPRGRSKVSIWHVNHGMFTSESTGFSWKPPSLGVVHMQHVVWEKLPI